MIKLINGDCLIENEKIESGSVDLILTDLPYGTVKGINNINHGMSGKCDWDMAIDPIKIFNIANRILRENGKMVLFSQEPYTSSLISNAIHDVPFCYRMIWEKDHFANSLIAQKAPVSYFEDILVFNKSYDSLLQNPLRNYFRTVFDFMEMSKTEIKESLGQDLDHVFRLESNQFKLCTENAYNKLIKQCCIESMNGFKTYEELKKINSKYLPTFNLWQGNKYKSNILRYTKDYDGYHPTQKPIALLEDIIKTYTNKGDNTVDLTGGSGSTAVACVDTDRNCTSIEKELKFHKLQIERCRIMKIDKASRLF